MKKERLTLYTLALSFLLLAPCSLHRVAAQTSGMNSTYSRFGLGLQRDQSQGFNRSMGGVGVGVRLGSRVNMLNPASYSAIDSLSMILDVGMSASFGKMQQGAKSLGVKNASFEYAHFGMRLCKGLGFAFGLLPYTSIGYLYSSPEQPITSNFNTTQTISSRITYGGSGGLNQVYGGLGWSPLRQLSVGVNAGFMWGRYEHYLMPTFTEGGQSSDAYSALIKSYTSSLRTYRIDIGVQSPVRLSPTDWLTIGATYGVGHKIAQDASLMLYTLHGDSTQYIAPSPFDLPHTVSYGAAWQHGNKLLVAGDVRHELWSSCRLPVEIPDGYIPQKGAYRNLTKVALGAQWTPDPFGKNFWKRIQYRMGFNYATPHLMVNGQKGPSEMNVTMGVGVPIINRTNSRSVVNFGLQWQRRAANGPDMVRENYLLLNLGLTFNERWFVKYKIE